MLSIILRMIRLLAVVKIKQLKFGHLVIVIQSKLKSRENPSKKTLKVSFLLMKIWIK